MYASQKHIHTRKHGYNPEQQEASFIFYDRTADFFARFILRLGLCQWRPHFTLLLLKVSAAIRNKRRWTAAAVAGVQTVVAVLLARKRRSAPKRFRAMFAKPTTALLACVF